ncbi:unnamed protein product [Boreogadus saida]
MGKVLDTQSAHCSPPSPPLSALLCLVMDLAVCSVQGVQPSPAFAVMSPSQRLQSSPPLCSSSSLVECHRLFAEQQQLVVKVSVWVLSGRRVPGLLGCSRARCGGISVRNQAGASRSDHEDQEDPLSLSNAVLM